jgi:hypothetical protein
MASFGSTEEGAALIAEWGKAAPRKVAAVKARMGMIFDAMTPADRSAAEAWLNGLTAVQAKALLQGLAG